MSTKKFHGTVGFRLSEELDRAIIEFAEDNGRTKSNSIKHILTEYLDQEGYINIEQ